MDHLFLREGQNALYYRTPCVYDDNLEDFPPFVQYPGILGWNIEDVNYRANWSIDPKFLTSRPRKSKRQAEQLLQGWLFFGLLKTFFHQGIAPVFQESDGSGRCYVNTRQLPHLLGIQRQYYLNSSAEHLGNLLLLMKHCLNQTSTAMEFIAKDYSRIDSGIVYSIAVLGHTLENFIAKRRSDRANDLPEFENILPLKSWRLDSVDNPDMLTRHLNAVGWCPSEIRRISLLDPGSKYLVSQMDRPHPELSHGNDCTAFRCVAYNMDKSSYKTEHVCEFSNCEWFQADTTTLDSILFADHIPVIVLEFKADVPGRLRIEKASDFPEYVAISHVWSDKLGNPKNNAMPLCQVHRLARMVKALPSTSASAVSFWIDTLCCPVLSDAARKQAIRLMRRTYMEASKVLVVEKYLTVNDVFNTTPLERFLRLYCSTWTTRLWTLQEGFLARSLYIQFKDTAIAFLQNLNDVLESREYEGQPSAGLSDFLSQYAIHRLPQLNTNPFLLSISQVQKFLFQRQTSWAEDEALCLGVLLGQDVEDLFSGDGETRISRFWKRQTAIPSDIIFLRRGPRLKESGLRWAPVSFMVPENERLIGVRESMDRYDCVRIEDGLIVTYPGLLFTAPMQDILLPEFYIRPSDDTRKYFVKMDHWVFLDADLDITIGRLSESESIQLPSGNRTIALICRLPVKNLGSVFDLEMGGIHVSVVLMWRNLEDTLYVTLLTNGIALLEARGHHLCPEERHLVPKIHAGRIPDVRDLESRSRENQVFQVSPLPADQKWCVG